MRFLSAAFPTRIERFAASLAIASGFIGFCFILRDAAKIAGVM